MENQQKMNYKEQMTEWIEKHPEATIQEAWEAGYLICCSNWCNRKRQVYTYLYKIVQSLISKIKSYEKDQFED